MRELYVAEDGTFTTLEIGKTEFSGDRFSGLLRLHGNRVLLGTTLEHLDVWYADELVSLATTATVPLENRSTAVRTIATPPDGKELVISIGHGEIVSFDPRTGTERWRLQVTDGVPIEHLVWQGRFIVVGDRDGAIHVWNVDGRDRNGPSMMIGKRIDALTTVRSGDQSLILATVSNGLLCEAKVWDFTTRDDVGFTATGQRRRFHLTAGEEDKALHGLAACDFGTYVRFAFAGNYGKVMVADFPEQNPERFWDFEEWHVPASQEHIRVLSTWEGLPISETPLLVAGSDHGRLTVWDFASGRIISSRMNAHLGTIRGVRFLLIQGIPWVVSGGDDGALNFWNTELTRNYRIDLGAPVLCIALAGSKHIAIGTERGLSCYAWIWMRSAQ